MKRLQTENQGHIACFEVDGGGRGLSLRSLPVQTILKWSQDGSQHPRFNEEDLLAIPVPDAVLRIRPKVNALVHGKNAQRSLAIGLRRRQARYIRLVFRDSRV